MVERKGHEHKLRSWYPKLEDLPSSLNQDKLKVIPLHPFTDREQYKVYLKCRDVALPQTTTATTTATTTTALAPSSNEVVAAVHLVSGGRLHAMKSPSKVTLPPAGEAERHVIERLTTAQASLPFDAFNLAAVTEDELVSWLQEWKSANPHSASASVDINTLLNANIIAQNPVTGMFTFGVPMHLYLQRKLQPRIFLSHATDRLNQIGDQHNPLFQQLVRQLEKAGADVTVCESPQSQRSASIFGLNQWMMEQMDNRANHFVVIVLSDMYVQRTREDTSGCKAELQFALENHTTEPHLSGKGQVFAVSLGGPFDAKWTKDNALVAKLADVTIAHKLVSQADIDNMCYYFLGRKHAPTQQAPTDTPAPASTPSSASLS
jgi:hypothetical protein